MKAKNLHHLSSHPAPDEWTKIPEIQKAKPKIRNAEISLQVLDDTNIVYWMKRETIYWNPASDFFLIIP